MIHEEFLSYGLASSPKSAVSKRNIFKACTVEIKGRINSDNLYLEINNLKGVSE